MQIRGPEPQRSRAAGPRAPVDRRFVLACATVYLGVIALCAQSLGYGPIALDDLSQLRHMTDRPLGSIWSSDAFGHFRPLKNLVFWWLAQDRARVVAVRACALLALLASMALVQRLIGQVTHSRWQGLAVAGLWGLNPTTASVLCWLSTFNVVAAQLSVLVYVTLALRSLRPGVQQAGPAAGAICSLGLALLSHELAVVAPLLAWACAHALGHARPAWRGAVVLGSGVAVALYLSVHLARVAPTHAYRTEASDSWLLTFSAARYFVDNALLYLWPRGRFGVLLTDEPGVHLLRSGVCWALLIGALSAWWRARGRDRAGDLGVVWLLLTLLPVCNLAPLGNTPVAVHYLYAPGVGLAILLCRGMRLLTRKISERTHLVAHAGAVLIALLLWLPETRRAVAAFHAEEALYLNARAHDPDNVEVLSNLASYYLSVRDYERARPLLARARALAPRDEGVLINGVALHLSTGEPAAALALLDAQPDLGARPEFATRRAEALEALGRDREAAAMFELGYQAAAADPEQRFIAGYRLMVVLLRLGQGARAEALLDQLLAQFPEREELQLARRLMSEE